MSDILLASNVVPRNTRGAGAVIGDSLVMATRSLRLSRREVDALLTSLVLPVMMMVMFVYLFGGAIETGRPTSPTSSPGSC